MSSSPAFLGALPKDFRYAIELRNPGLWKIATPTAAQARCRPCLQSIHRPFTVIRLLTPLKMTYEAAKKRAEPYNKIVGELPKMRVETVDLVKQAVSRSIRAYVLVNNRTEGNAPLTVQALVDFLSADLNT